ncbi:MAG TPA: L-threonylcarbamoyladenylate synthase [Bacilli bacterium]|jgi:L-threonylcarbamoyladenylate synthase|nr:L-threonylcarbamoyladenylate synthase [Bacilli bacterium]HQA56190.1 L-threonylcarbamoyladenylate synthase [Bacilli bacterium]
MDKKSLKQQIQEASFSLLNHGVVAFPTETVMGLGVVYNDKEAYDRLNAIKHRLDNHPYTMMLSSPEEVEKYALIDERSKKIIKAFMPGSITLLLPVGEHIPEWVTHNTGIIGMRVPSNEEALWLLQTVGLPLLVPSANRSGENPALDSNEVKSIFGNELDYIIEGKSTSSVPSTIVDLTNTELKIIRQGPISREEIEAIIKRN